MTLPSYEDFMLPVLREAARADAITLEGLVSRVADALGLDDEARAATFPWNQQRMVDARTEHAARDLEKAGLVEVRGGAFSATARGRGLLEAAPERLDRAALERFPEYAAYREEVLRRRGA